MSVDAVRLHVMLMNNFFIILRRKILCLGCMPAARLYFIFPLANVRPLLVPLHRASARQELQNCLRHHHHHLRHRHHHHHHLRRRHHRHPHLRLPHHRRYQAIHNR